MKLFIIISALTTFFLSNSDCKQKIESTTKYKGRLEIKGICMNYTISLLEGEMEMSKIADEWTDEMTHKTYENVFALENPCNFPSAIKEHDEFYFVLDTTVQRCEVCLAYYPVPPKKLSIKVVDQ
jgi:hypothetical protein